MEVEPRDRVAGRATASRKDEQGRENDATEMQAFLGDALRPRWLVMAFLAAFAAGCGGNTAPKPTLKPLSSLGPLRPAPAPGLIGPEIIPTPRAPALAPSGAEASQGKTIDGIKCQVNERVAFHVHVHLTLFVNGTPRAVPAGIGIWPPIGPQNYRNGQFGVVAGNCFYWLATRYADGLVHVESPTLRSFTLGDFFKIWGQPLSRTQLGPFTGAVTAIVNREVWDGDPRLIPMVSHAQVQLEVGQPLVAPQTITFPGLY